MHFVHCPLRIGSAEVWVSSITVCVAFECGVVPCCRRQNCRASVPATSFVARFAFKRATKFANKQNRVTDGCEALACSSRCCRCVRRGQARHYCPACSGRTTWSFETFGRLPCPCPRMFLRRVACFLLPSTSSRDRHIRALAVPVRLCISAAPCGRPSENSRHAQRGRRGACLRSRSVVRCGSTRSAPQCLQSLCPPAQADEGTAAAMRDNCRRGVCSLTADECVHISAL